MIKASLTYAREGRRRSKSFPLDWNWLIFITSVNFQVMVRVRVWNRFLGRASATVRVRIKDKKSMSLENFL